MKKLSIALALTISFLLITTLFSTDRVGLEAPTSILASDTVERPREEPLRTLVTSKFEGESRGAYWDLRPNDFVRCEFELRQDIAIEADALWKTDGASLDRTSIRTTGHAVLRCLRGGGGTATLFCVAERVVVEVSPTPVPGAPPPPIANFGIRLEEGRVSAVGLPPGSTVATRRLVRSVATSFLQFVVPPGVTAVEVDGLQDETGRHLASFEAAGPAAIRRVKSSYDRTSPWVAFGGSVRVLDSDAVAGFASGWPQKVEGREILDMEGFGVRLRATLAYDYRGIEFGVDDTSSPEADALEWNEIGVDPDAGSGGAEFEEGPDFEQTLSRIAELGAEGALGSRDAFVAGQRLVELILGRPDLALRLEAAIRSGLYSEDLASYLISVIGVAGSRGSTAAADVLARLLVDPGLDDVLKYAVLAAGHGLGVVGAPFVRALVDFLPSASGVLVSVAMLTVGSLLGTTSDAEAEAALEAAWSRLRSRAVESGAEADVVRAAGNLRDRGRVRDIVEAAARSADPEVLVAVVDALDAARDASWRTEVLSTLAAGTDLMVAGAALRALRSAPSEDRVFDAVRVALANPVATIRYAALEVLAERTADPRSAPLVGLGLGDPEATVRELAGRLQGR